MKLRNKKTYINYVPEGEPPASKKRKLVKYLYFLLLGFILFQILFYFYLKISYLEVTGYIEVPKFVIHSYSEGEIRKLFVREGSFINRGQPVAEISTVQRVSVSPEKTISIDIKTRSKELEIKKLKWELNLLNSGYIYMVVPEILDIDRNIKEIMISLKEKKNELERLKCYINGEHEKHKKNVLLELSTVDEEKSFKYSNLLNKIKYEIELLEEKKKSLERKRQKLIASKKRELLFKLETLSEEIRRLESVKAKFKEPVGESVFPFLQKSPVSGKVLKVFKKEGDFVLKNDSIMTVVSEEREVFVFLYCSPKDLPYLKKDITIDLLFPEDISIKGKIVEVYSTALPVSNELTENYIPIGAPIKVKVLLTKDFPNLEMFDGMKIKVRIKKL